MFTLKQIKIAHGKVNSGADFPNYIQELKGLGVVRYDVFVTDGSIVYQGLNHFTLNAPAIYEALNVATSVQLDEFKMELKAHQNGKTDYLTFIEMCARCGIEKWRIVISEMTCTYYSAKGEVVLVEDIPLQ